MGINMRVFILIGTLLLVQLSHQAAVLEAAPNVEDVSELAFPDGEVEEAAPRDGETTGINDGVCVPMTWDGEEGVLCTEDEYSWCATAVDENGSWTAYDWCGYGSISGDTCVPLIWDGVEYHGCTSGGWCATSSYSNMEYYSWKYCTEDDYDYHYYECKCSFEDYEDYYGYELDWPSDGADRSLERKKMRKHAGRSLDR